MLVTLDLQLHTLLIPASSRTKVSPFRRRNCPPDRRPQTARPAFTIPSKAFNTNDLSSSAFPSFFRERNRNDWLLEISLILVLMQREPCAALIAIDARPKSGPCKSTLP